MKKYILNISSSMVHKNTCRYVRNLDEIKKREFHTLNEAKNLAKALNFVKCVKLWRIVIYEKNCENNFCYFSIDNIVFWMYLL